MWASKKLDPTTGKAKIKFITAVNKNDDINALKLACLSNKEILIKLPCGKCIDCRLQNSRTWANRCMLETKEHKQNYFITLTYNPENLPTGMAIDTNTGETYEVGTLHSKDLQDFFKRLRIHYKRKHSIENIRFYACGEYGDLYERPHYHAIIFGLPIFDLKQDQKSKRGNLNYRSEEIEKIWGKGRVAIGNVTWESCAYTARYILKKQTGKSKNEYYKILGREPEFVRMSRNPGIGKKYFDKNFEKIYKTDEIYISTSKGVQRIKPSRYYDKLFDIKDPDEFKIIKEKRKSVSELKERMKYINTDMDKQEAWQNEIEGRDLARKSLKRNFEKGKQIFI